MSYIKILADFFPPMVKIPFGDAQNSTHPVFAVNFEVNPPKCLFHDFRSFSFRILVNLFPPPDRANQIISVRRLISIGS